MRAGSENRNAHMRDRKSGDDEGGGRKKTIKLSSYSRNRFWLGETSLVPSKTAHKMLTLTLEGTIFLSAKEKK